MANINALIAMGGGYQPPKFDYATMQRQNAAMETQGLQNQLLRGQVEAQPAMQEIQQKRMMLREESLSLREEAIRLAKQGQTTISLDTGDGYKLKGDSEAITQILGETAENADKVVLKDGSINPQYLRELASRGISLEQIEETGPPRGTPKYEAMLRREAEIKAQVADKYRGKPTSEKDPDFIKRRNEIEKVYGVDRETATGIATGVLAINTNPVTGESVLVDKVRGTSRPITQEGQAPASSETEAGTPDTASLWELADLSTGAWSALKAAWGATAGQFGAPIAEKTEYARQRMRSSQQKLIRALSINPRFPVAEMNRIKEETRISPEVFDSAQSLKVRMKAIDDYLREVEASTRAIAANSSMPKDQRQAAIQSAAAIQSFRAELGVPEEEPNTLSDEISRLIDKYAPEGQ